MIRVWSNLDTAVVKKQLMLVDDLYGVCSNCNQTGLKYTEHRECPNCKARFRYLATRQTNPAEIAKMLGRIQKDKLELQLIDRNDFEKSSAKNQLDQLFSS